MRSSRRLAQQYPVRGLDMQAAIRVGALEQGVLALGSGAPWGAGSGDLGIPRSCSRRGEGEAACEGEKKAEGAQRPLRGFSLRWIQAFVSSYSGCLAPSTMMVSCMLTVRLAPRCRAMLGPGRLVWLFLSALWLFLLCVTRSDIVSGGVQNGWACCARALQSVASPGAGGNREEKVRQPSRVWQSGEAAVIDLDRIWRPNCPGRLAWCVRSSNYLFYPPSLFRLATNHSPLGQSITSKGMRMSLAGVPK
ncbi:hypothetical protein TARUN_1587 [Trichoderma arundinaceum]|uniref:Uncharacterized protein n=1 Tax=Trichoderma arundinaceum TaxID=490622 RepID=A0A395NYS3_TRIAR|nr:hypothetical protein TARUN_1587 [Trichoderma arundinaceum]